MSGAVVAAAVRASSGESTMRSVALNPASSVKPPSAVSAPSGPRISSVAFAAGEGASRVSSAFAKAEAMVSATAGPRSAGLSSTVRSEAFVSTSVSKSAGSAGLVFVAGPSGGLMVVSSARGSRILLIGRSRSGSVVIGPDGRVGRCLTYPPRGNDVQAMIGRSSERAGAVL